MKRTYITPSSEIVRVLSEQMIAASGITFDDDFAIGEGFLNDETVVGGSALSKDYDFDLW